MPKINSDEIEDHLHGWESFKELETDFNKFGASLNIFAAYIGWVIIYFNSLEDSITDEIKEQLSDRPTTDRLIFVLISKMGYSEKVDALSKILGMTISWLWEKQDAKVQAELSLLCKALHECATRRNRYAHGDWTGVSKHNFVKVKTKAKNNDIVHLYRNFSRRNMRNDINFILKTTSQLNRLSEKISLRISRRP